MPVSIAEAGFFAFWGQVRAVTERRWCRVS